MNIMSLRSPTAVLALVALLSGCAAFPELDGKPVGAIRAATLSQPSGPEPRLNFVDMGDPALRRMLAEADLNSLDVAAARGRARAADMTVAQTSMGRLPQIGANGSRAREGYSAGMSISFEPDLAGRLEAQLTAAQLESQATGLDLLVARRLLAREVITGWAALAEAQTVGARSGERLALADRDLALVRARLSGGEAVGTALSEALSRQSNARMTAAGAQGQIALAGARLRALGVRTVPDRISLRQAALPKVPAQTDLSRLDARPEVCAAWLRFHAADAARAEALRANRPRIAASGSLGAAAKTLAGLVSGNPLAIGGSLSLDGVIFDGGQSRSRLDQARLGVAQAEIGWLQARSRAEITAMEATIEMLGARDALDSARTGYGVAAEELRRARARKTAGVDDGSALLTAETAVLDAQIAIDTARARAVRAAALYADATAAPVAACPPATPTKRSSHAAQTSPLSPKS